MRRSWLVAGAVVALAVTRVFAPGDTLDRAHGPYPAPVAAYGRVYGELMHAPLLVGTRMRVYGAQNRIWADGPVDDKMPTSALWALRRWPAQLVGVVADERVVVSRWSDGKVVAIDPDTGRIAWRADVGTGTVTAYQGRRTGAITLYEPSDFYLTSGTDGGPVVVSVGAEGRLTALDGMTGRVLRLYRPDRPERRVADRPGRRVHRRAGPHRYRLVARRAPGGPRVRRAHRGARRGDRGGGVVVAGRRRDRHRRADRGGRAGPGARGHA